MSKVNAKKNYSSTNYAKKSTKFFIQKKRKQKKCIYNKMGLRFKRYILKQWNLRLKNYQQIIHFSLSSHHGKIYHGKISLDLRVLYLNSKVQILILHTNK
jgi:hypothetical protein